MHLDHTVPFVESIQYDSVAFDGAHAAGFIKQCIAQLITTVQSASIAKGENFACFNYVSHSIYRNSLYTIITITGTYTHIS